jgi:hypothetical protein
VVEIVSPLFVNPIRSDGVELPIRKEIHNFYKNIAFMKKHTYVALPNQEFKVEDLEQFIFERPKLHNFLTEGLS